MRSMREADEAFRMESPEVPPQDVARDGAQLFVMVRNAALDQLNHSLVDLVLDLGEQGGNVAGLGEVGVRQE